MKSKIESPLPFRVSVSLRGYRAEIIQSLTTTLQQRQADSQRPATIEEIGQCASAILFGAGAEDNWIIPYDNGESALL